MSGLSFFECQFVGLASVHHGIQIGLEGLFGCFEFMMRRSYFL